MKKSTKIIFIILAITTVISLIAGSYFATSQGKQPEITPTVVPTMTTAPQETLAPTEAITPTVEPTTAPTEAPEPTLEPTEAPTVTEPVPTEEPVIEPTVHPTEVPDVTETPEPTATPEITPEVTEPAHVHNWVAKELAATCTQDGKTWEECECGEVQNEIIIPFLTHRACTYKVITEPTVDKDGAYETTCDVCGAVVNSGSIPKLTPTPTVTPLPTNTPTPTVTPGPTATPTPSPLPTATPTPAAPHLVQTKGQREITVRQDEMFEVAFGMTLDYYQEKDYEAFMFEKLNLNPDIDDSYVVYVGEEILNKGIITEGSTIYDYYALYPGEATIRGYLDTRIWQDGVDTETTLEEILVHVTVLPNEEKEEAPVVSEPVPAYDPVADGYTEHVNTYDYGNYTLETWKNSKKEITLVVKGTGVVEIPQKEPGMEQKVTAWRYNEIHFGEGITEIYGRASVYVKEIVFPSTLKVIGDGVFDGADVTELIFPEGLEVIESGAFRQTADLEKLVLPSTLRYLGGGAFGNNKLKEKSNKLLEVILSDNLKYAGGYVFLYRKNIKINYSDTLDTSGFSQYWDYLK